LPIESAEPRATHIPGRRGDSFAGALLRCGEILRKLCVLRACQISPDIQARQRLRAAIARIDAIAPIRSFMISEIFCQVCQKYLDQ
jgi:hypothetical protein